MALESLGYKDKEIKRYIKIAISNGAVDVQDNIKEVLRAV